MRILLDQGLPRSAARLLGEFGVDSVHAGDCGLACASDTEVLEFARKEDRIVVTLDADFHALIALSGAATPSVIRIRIEALPAEALVDILKDVLKRCHEDLTKGVLVSVAAGQIRLRRLPIEAQSSGSPSHDL